MMKSLWHAHCSWSLSALSPSALSLSALSLGCSLTLGFALTAGAHAELIKTESPHFVLFEPPTDDTLSESRGGASRTDVKCAEDDTYPFPLTALIPQSGLGLTARARPTLFVYVPPTTARQAHFTLRDSNHQGLYQTQIPIAPTGGILNITLPTDSPELSVGSRYQWSLGLLCQTPQTDMPIASGQIQRVEAPEAAAVANQSLWARANAYGRAGIWHDMLVSLVAIQQRQPQSPEPVGELSTDWARLLEAEQLGAIAQSPLLNETVAPTPK